MNSTGFSAGFDEISKDVFYYRRITRSIRAHGRGHGHEYEVAFRDIFDRVQVWSFYVVDFQGHYVSKEAFDSASDVSKPDDSYAHDVRLPWTRLRINLLSPSVKLAHDSDLLLVEAFRILAFEKTLSVERLEL